jgi:hypothetical protein
VTFPDVRDEGVEVTPDEYEEYLQDLAYPGERNEDDDDGE